MSLISLSADVLENEVVPCLDFPSLLSFSFSSTLLRRVSSSRLALRRSSAASERADNIPLISVFKMCSELDYVTLFEYFLRLFSTTVRSWLEGDLHLLLSPFLRRGNLALLKTATKILHGNLSDDVDHVMEYACVEALAIAVAERGQKALVEEYLELGRVDLEERSLISAIVRGSALSGNEELIEWALSFYPKSNWKSSYDFDSGYHVVKPSLVELTARGELEKIKIVVSQIEKAYPHLSPSAVENLFQPSMERIAHSENWRGILRFFLGKASDIETLGFVRGTAAADNWEAFEYALQLDLVDPLEGLDSLPDHYRTLYEGALENGHVDFCIRFFEIFPYLKPKRRGGNDLMAMAIRSNKTEAVDYVLSLYGEKDLSQAYKKGSFPHTNIITTLFQRVDGEEETMWLNLLVMWRHLISKGFPYDPLESGNALSSRILFNRSLTDSKMELLSEVGLEVNDFPILESLIQGAAVSVLRGLHSKTPHIFQKALMSRVVRSGRLQLIKFFLEILPESINVIKLTHLVILAEQDHINVLDYLAQILPPESFEFDNLFVLLLSNGYHPSGMKKILGIQWVLERGRIKLTETHFETFLDKFNKSSFRHCALSLFAWLLARGCPVPGNADALVKASKLTQKQQDRLLLLIRTPRS